MQGLLRNRVLVAVLLLLVRVADMVVQETAEVVEGAGVVLRVTGRRGRGVRGRSGARGVGGALSARRGTVTPRSTVRVGGRVCKRKVGRGGRLSLLGGCRRKSG